jgi:hypothetical protein
VAKRAGLSYNTVLAAIGQAVLVYPDTSHSEAENIHTIISITRIPKSKSHQ